ncbi:MAG: ParB/RepB/Spo0J family partition protein [Steroidobacteraceae bacterium]
MTTESAATQFRFIPLRDLDLSPLNVRKTGGDESIAALAELINSEGLLQNLSTYECAQREGEAEARYAVIAGGRRWRALRRLLDQGRITSEYPVPCAIVSYERAVQISLTENSGREAMHPADEFEAFKTLIDAGQTTEDVAARFGVAPVVVQRRLKLANVHPKFIALYRDGTLTLGHLMALAITDDQARQLEVWESLTAHDRSPTTIRDALTENEVSLRAPMARFVGLKAYEKAGGVVRRDLFAEKDEDVGLDGNLVRKLATAKLEKCAEKVRRDGVAWVRVCLDFDYATRAAYKHVKTVFRDPTEEEQKAFDDIATERGRIESEINEAQDDDERIAALERRAAELEQQEDALNAKLSVPDREQQALAGAVVTIGHDGKVQIERDLLRPEDSSRFAQAERVQRRTTGGPRVHSAALVRRLTAQRTLALQATLAERPDVALIALTHRLVLQAFPLYGGGRQSAVGVNAKHAGLGSYAEELAGCPAEAALRARCAALEAQLPKDSARLFGWLIELPQAELLSVLACCVALTVDAVQADEQPNAADELAQAAGLDMRSWWTPTADNYLSHVSRAQILDIVREAVSPEIAGALSKLTKQALAQAAERRLAGTGWLPKLLKTEA